MKMKLATSLSITAITLCLLTLPVLAVDLLERYPTPLTAGDTDPSHARSWQLGKEDIFHVSQFALKVGDGLKVETSSADVGIGHCADGAVWAVLIPRDHGTLTSSVASNGETIAHVWLRFHPARINRLFPPDTVSADGNTNLATRIRGIAAAKMTSSWQANGKAMIPGPEDMTVYVDTKEGAHRFFMVDTEAHTAEYVAAFNQESSDQISTTSIPPVVVKTIPEAGSKDVPPGEFEVKVTFSKEMHDRSWSWCTVWENSNPKVVQGPWYDTDHRTCVLKVMLEPNTTYGYWINTGRFTSFRDKEGRSAVPYLLVFQTKQN
jgi:RNA polymerase sigma-70 factor (ECF subfamily)